jgi:hypothetical protein
MCDEERAEAHTRKKKITLALAVLNRGLYVVGDSAVVGRCSRWLASAGAAARYPANSR